MRDFYRSLSRDEREEFIGTGIVVVLIAVLVIGFIATRW